MRKIININFQGRVIPIEETAYDILKQYIESLRVFFANEEGRDEIINDIEGRIAELFGETLKKGASCITDTDVDIVISSIGRPEDFEDEETKVKEQLQGSEARQQQSKAESQAAPETGRGHLYRDSDDKILGGVCAGIASYFRIDPAIIRILFAVVTLGGFGSGFLLYILLWIVLPVKRLDRAIIGKRLYRNPEEKVIAGVASGVAAYFNIGVWIPRLVFAFPLVIAVLTSIWRNLFWEHFSVPSSIVFSSFGGTFFLIYAILWIVIPEASSASEKLEMRGEKVDLNSIKNTIQEDLGSFRQKAEKWGEEFKTKAQQWGEELGDTVQSKSREASSYGRNTGSRIGGMIGTAFKAFFLFVAGMIAFGLLLVVLALIISGVSIAPLSSFFIEGFWQNFLVWCTLVLFLAVPLVALLVWLIRRVVGARSKNNYLGYIFGGLWTLGWVSIVLLCASVSKNYRYRTAVQENVQLTQPTKGKLLVKVSDGRFRYNMLNYEDNSWFGLHLDEDNAPFFNLSKDSLLMRSVQVKLVKSIDSSFHLHVLKFSNGSSPLMASSYAQEMSFQVQQQQDTMLLLPAGFTITNKGKFHNQQALVIIEIPVGKRIVMDETLNEYNFFNASFNSRRRRGWAVEWQDNWNNDYSWDNNNKEYIMTANDGLKPTHEKQKNAKDARDEVRRQMEDLREKQEELRRKQEDLEREYRNEEKNDSTKIRAQVMPAAPVRKETILPGKRELQLKPNPAGMLLMKFTR